MIIIQDLKEIILNQLKTKELVIIPASESEYLFVASQLPFKIEYHNSEIVTMGLSSYWHEVLVMTFGRLISNLLEKYGQFTVLGSNVGIQIPRFEGGYYLPDIMVVKGDPIFKANSTAIITNPYIIIEVLSPATQEFDLANKLPEYKLLESLEQIVFVNQKKSHISTYIRTPNPTIWMNQDFYLETDSILIENEPILLQDIYKKIKFDA